MTALAASCCKKLFGVHLFTNSQPEEVEGGVLPSGQEFSL